MPNEKKDHPPTIGCSVAWLIIFVLMGGIGIYLENSHIHLNQMMELLAGGLMLLGILGTIAAISMTFDAIKAKPAKALPKEPATPQKKEPKVKPTKTPSEEFAPPSAHTTGLLSPHSLLDKHYQIISRLGQGGMGAVYKAADIKLGNRPVAVKEMSQHGLDSQKVTEAIDAFKREALLLARLHHHHLPHIYDHFEEGGRWYLVMDFIEGETLQEYLDTRGGQLPVREALDIGIQLSGVLCYLHQQQPPIIFRDLKPDNVMRTPDGDLYLIDFGIARHFKPGQSKDTAAYGTVGYAAPEQFGKAQTTPRSDIYSLGATLHQLLSGDDPAENPFQFTPLTGAGISAELSTLILSMVKMIENERPANMADVQQALQRIAAHPAGG